jgi:hypothetical protein
MTVLLSARLLLIADAAASPALTSKKPPPPPGRRRQWPHPAAGAQQPGGWDTLKLISGTVPPRPSVVPPRECMIAFGEAPEPGHLCSGSRPPARARRHGHPGLQHHLADTRPQPGQSGPRPGLPSTSPGRDQQPWRDRWLWRPDLPRRDSAEPQQPDPAGLQSTLDNATAIDDGGQIVASGSNSTGQEHAFPPTPS